MTRVLCMGEVVWDLFPDGPVPGGAPFNTAVHLARQGVSVTLLTAVGQDALGERLLAFLAAEGIAGARVHPVLPTGTVQVALDAQGGPSFTIQEGCAWTDLAGAHGPPAPESSAVLVFGGVAMHAPGNRRLLLAQPGAVRLCDLNLRPGWSDPEVLRWCLEQAQVLKVNAQELAALLQQEGLADAAALMARFGLEGLCVTLGADGLRWRGQDEAELALPVAQPGVAGPLVDTVGAGDAITAALAMGLARGQAPAVFLERGRLWAARTCAVRGALPARSLSRE